jgi:uncharacterized OsmC-like protein
MPSEARIHAVNDGGWVVTAGDGDHGITMDYPAPGVDQAAVERALALSEETLCPVWAMLKDGTPITASCGVVP